MVDYWEGEKSDDSEMEFEEVVDGYRKEKEEEENTVEELHETEHEVSEETSTAPAETEVEVEVEENEKPHTPLTPEEMRKKRLEFLERCNSANKKPQDEEN